MGRLKPILATVGILPVAALIEFCGYRADAVYAFLTPEFTLAVSLVAIYLLSLWTKANRITMLTITAAGILYGIIAYALKLDFYYHDIPDSFWTFSIIIAIKTAVYLVPAAAAYFTLKLITRRKLRSNQGHW